MSDSHSGVLESFLQFLMDVEFGRKVRIEPFETGWRIRVSDGRQLVEHSELSHQEGIELAEFLLKEAGILDKAMDLPAVGNLKLSVGAHERWLQVSSVPVIWGVTLVVTVIRTELPFLDIDHLGFNADVVCALRAVFAERSGLTIIGGKSRSGRSTTLRALLAASVGAGKKVSSIEYADQGVQHGVETHLADPAAGTSVAHLMRSLLQGDGEVIKTYLDFHEETMLALEMAAERVVLADSHIPDAIGVIPRFLNNGVPPAGLARNLRLVIVQRLVPELCPSCKKRSAASPAMLKSLGINATFLSELGLSDVQLDGIGFFQKVGCGRCQNRGSIGGIPIAEVLPMTREMAELVQNWDNDRATLERAAARAGWVPLRKQALALALRGRIRVEDALMG